MLVNEALQTNVPVDPSWLITNESVSSLFKFAPAPPTVKDIDCCADADTKLNIIAADVPLAPCLPTIKAEGVNPTPVTANVPVLEGVKVPT